MLRRSSARLGLTALTLLLLAANGHAETVRLLLDRRAEHAAKNESGNTALSYAISKGHEDVAELLRRIRTGEGEATNEGYVKGDAEASQSQ